MAWYIRMQFGLGFTSSSIAHYAGFHESEDKTCLATISLNIVLRESFP